MPRVLILLSVLLIFALSSCFYNVSYTYYIKNSADTTINVCYKKFESSTKFDTLVVEKDSMKIFQVITRSQHKKKYVSHDAKEGIVSMYIYKRSSSSKKDFKSNDTWAFDADKGTYTTTVVNSDF